MTSNVEAIDPALETGEQNPSGTFLHTATRSTSWWVVSVMFHVLVIALAALMSIAITLPNNDDTVVIMTEFSKRPEMSTPEKPRELPTEIPIDPNPEIKLPRPTDGVGDAPELLGDVEKLAALSDADETENPDRLDKHSALGEKDANSRYDITGHTGKVGGGGDNGPSLSMEDVIGVGATGTQGTGFGLGGGNGSGIGNGDGNGFASRGDPDGAGRHARRRPPGCTLQWDQGMENALRWLAYHQEADGHWDTVKFGSGQKTDTAMTGMSLLAFLGAGYSERAGKYKVNVQRAVGWLKAHQQANGLIFDQTDAGAHRGIGYPGAIATLALAEAAGMGRIEDTKIAAQKAINYCVEQHQCGEGSDKLGWRYGPKQAGDTSVTGWYVMALKSAKIAGLHVDTAAFDGALKFLKSVEFKNDGGDTSYGPSVHYGYQPGDEHTSSSHRLTAIGALIKTFLGAPKEEVSQSVEWFVNKGGVPSWGANGEKVDMYYWYYGSLCTFQIDGPIWERWRTDLIKTLTENQCKQGDDAGSWPIVGEFSGEWGRVGQTALGCLSYEVWERYSRVKWLKIKK